MAQTTRWNPQGENLTPPPKYFFLWFIIGLANLFDVRLNGWLALWLK